MGERKTKEEIVKEFTMVHGNKYDYSKTIYKNMHNKIVITCLEHGEFEQTPSNHRLGKGCPKCAGNAKISYTEFLEKVNKVHNNKYNYSKVIYGSTNTNIVIVCPIHGEFEQMAKNHLEGKGCTSCAVTGFKSSKAATLYYLKILTESDQELYKIGITNRTVNERFSLADLKKIEIIKLEEFEVGTDAQYKETEIKRKFKEYQYKGPAVLENGNTEVFTKDILAEYD